MPRRLVGFHYCTRVTCRLLMEVHRGYLQRRGHWIPTAVMNLSSFVDDYPGIIEARSMLRTSLDGITVHCIRGIIGMKYLTGTQCTLSGIKRVHSVLCYTFQSLGRCKYACTLRGLPLSTSAKLSDFWTPSPLLVCTSVRLFVRKIGQFFDPLPPSLRTYLMDGP